MQEKIYAGIIGKAIGVRLGAPIEPYQWDYNRIYKSYGDIRGYIKDSHRFAADDDTNGPIFFLRSLIDNQSLEVNAEYVGHTWLNYARDGQGMFWWGGVGVSTEHTAYNHLKSGVIPPLSGSSTRNGKALSEQVGGQIFIDTWGLINPGNITKAMHDASVAASVAHDGEALNGARFIAGMIAGAFEYDDLKALISLVLGQLERDSEYARVMFDIYEFYLKHPDNFRDAYDYVLKHYSYDHYEGMCHVIPNACIVMIGLLYGEADFARSIEITCMCGWDTDSNAGVVGSIMGVFCGLDQIPLHYREPINDIIIASSMSPTLNVVNVVDFAKLCFNLALGKIIEKTELNLDFSLKGASSGLQVSNDFRLVKDQITWQSESGYNLLIDNLVKGDRAAIYYQTFYQVSDFGDNRYDPVFAPLAHSGQELTITAQSDIDFIDALHVRAYMETVDGDLFCGSEYHLISGEPKTISYTLPDTKGKLIKKIGLMLSTDSGPIDGNGLLGRIIIKEFKLSTHASYLINQQSFEYGFLDNVAPFSNQRIQTNLVDMGCHFKADETGLAITGNYYAKDISFDTTFKNISGDCILIPYRLLGLENYEYVSIYPTKVQFGRRYHLEDLISKEMQTALDFSQDLSVQVSIRGNQALLTVNGVSYDFDGIVNTHGHFGVGGINISFVVSEIQVEIHS